MKTMALKNSKSTLSVLIAASALALAPAAAFAQAQPTEAASATAANPLPSPDKEFVQAATMSSSTEIDASKLAMTHSSDTDVKAFAGRMIVDHTALTAKLKIAAPSNVEAPKDNSDTAQLDKLKGLKDRAFDDAYIQSAVAGHKKAIAAFEKEANGGQNADLKKAAQEGLPTIQHHLQMAQDLAAKKGLGAQ